MTISQVQSTVGLQHNATQTAACSSSALRGSRTDGQTLTLLVSGDW